MHEELLTVKYSHNAGSQWAIPGRFSITVASAFRIRPLYIHGNRALRLYYDEPDCVYINDRSRVSRATCFCILASNIHNASVYMCVYINSCECPWKFSRNFLRYLTNFYHDFFATFSRLLSPPQINDLIILLLSKKKKRRLIFLTENNLATLLLRRY